jgi:uncharacterized membrane protein
MENRTILTAGLAMGAGLMYFLDPGGGRRRRALIGDQLRRVGTLTGEALGATSRDARNRGQGLLAETRSMFRSWTGRERGDDAVLAERVRSQLGFLVSHPRSIGVVANQGRITLSGPILAHEVDTLLEEVTKVPGVTRVDNHLDMHREPGDISGLQGGPARPRGGRQFEFWQENWSPTARVLAGALGGGLIVYGARQRNLPGMAMATVGLGLMARGVTNLDLQRLTGIGAGRSAIEVHKTINIAAPLEKVFEFWTDYEQYPRFAETVRYVRMTEEGRSHWMVEGPAGVPIEWKAVIVRQVPNRELAWKTEPDSVVQHSGRVLFERHGDRTTVHIHMSYNPPAGAIGHGAAALMGFDLKSVLDEELMRLKSVIETGKFPERGSRHAAGTHKPQHQEPGTRSKR